MEDITGGERVRAYVVEGLVGGDWKELASGTAIGHKKIDRIEPATVAAVRLRITEAVGEPIIRSLAVYNTEAGAR
jgi:alpha-L-fucosidase